MLQKFNEYLVAKIGVDTAENEPSKVWPASNGRVFAELAPAAVRARLPRLPAQAPLLFLRFLFPRLVLGCINADFCNQILILQHLSRSTRSPEALRQA